MQENLLPSLVQESSAEARHTDTVGEHKNKSLRDVGRHSDNSHCLKGLCLLPVLVAYRRIPVISPPGYKPPWL